MLEMINTGSVELTAPQIIPFSTVTFSTNDNVTGNPTAGIANITTPGFYEITGNFVIEATAEGSVTVNMLADGQAVPGATAGFSAAAADVTETITISKVIQVTPDTAGNVAQVSFQTVSGSAAATMTNAVMKVNLIQ